MSDDDKPFVCMDHGCGMQFTNEDHLSVHMRKHDMSLALNLSTSVGGLSPMGLFTDQTPTPTKFLKNCEEIGLFQELTKNPFDDSFKKAMDDPLDQTGEENPIPIPGPDSHGVLDTPQLALPRITVDDSDISTHMKALDKIKERADTALSSIVPKKRKKFLIQSKPTSTTSEDEDESMIGSSSVETETPVQSVADKGNNSPTSVSSSTVEVKPTVMPTTVLQETKPAVTSSPLMMQVFLQLPGGQTIPVQVPATTLTPQQQQVINPEQILQLNTGTAQQQTPQVTNVTQTVPPIVVPGAQVIQTISGNLPNNVQKIVTQSAGTASTNIPLNVRTITLGTNSQSALTGIRTILSQAPAAQTSVQTATVISPQNSVIQPAQNVITLSSNSFNMTPKTTQSGSQSYTKQRLKAALQQQSTPSSSQKISQIFQMVGQMKRDSPVPMDTQSVVSSSGSVSPEERVSSYSYGAQMVPDSLDDPDARRKKFLERNRAAAARCRQKRKHWVVNLESKADELTQMNNKLSSDIKALRGEVAQLKTLLLAHKDCPITLQQKSQGKITPQTYVIDHPHSDSDTTQIQTESAATTNGMLLPNVISLDQSTSQEIGSPGSVSSADMIPITIDQSHPISSGAFVPTIITIDQSNNQTVTTLPVSADLVPSIITMGQPAADGKHMGVITGPNSLAMIPKIINMENIMKTSNSHRS